MNERNEPKCEQRHSPIYTSRPTTPFESTGRVSPGNGCLEPLSSTGSFTQHTHPNWQAVEVQQPTTIQSPASTYIAPEYQLINSIQSQQRPQHPEYVNSQIVPLPPIQPRYLAFHPRELAINQSIIDWNRRINSSLNRHPRTNRFINKIKRFF
jgi:hypothetical protein